MNKIKDPPLLDEDDEVRELTADDFAHMQPLDRIDPALAAYGKRRRGERGPQKAPTKVSVTLRLDTDVVDSFKEGGPGWQTRINDQLRMIVHRGMDSTKQLRRPKGHA